MTKRTSTFLTNELASTGQKTISGAMLQDLIDSSGVYGELRTDDAQTPKNLTSTYSKLDKFTVAGPASGMTVSTTLDRITATIDGTYIVHFHMCGQTGDLPSINHFFTFNLFKNGVAVQGAITCFDLRLVYPVAPVVVPIVGASFSKIVTGVVANDYFEIFGNSLAVGGLNFTVLGAQLVIQKSLRD